ncbi:hypothetical protein GPECTOR_125g508 [Gonium pectorale]|uniref:Uncharacterized protein n=1 Tax=Gonium pectorale TaxID=33097 RepID=A0A150FZN0_GONPE|nr:hypothetical protein GPECTOR_125g508 [Gonium pectorale]|eukprot:KXZ42675.1 hypothetical protein GPECTOR_125g508 [Gonium pectorale]
MQHHWAKAVWPQLPPELADHIATFLDLATIAWGFRLVNKAVASKFRGPEHTIIHLSQPVSPPAFAAHWLTPGATGRMTLARREQLLCLVAASGVAANLEVAVRATGCLPTVEVFAAAAIEGQGACCLWLRAQDCPTNEREGGAPRDLLAAAAGAGQRRICNWLLTTGLCPWSWQAVGAALRSGRVGLAEWLLVQSKLCTDDAWDTLLPHVAHGCGMPALQSAWQRAFPGRGRGNWEGCGAATLAAAAGSPTPDWAAKVEWLEAQGCARSAEALEAAAACADEADAAARLVWLWGRGYPIGELAVMQAVKAGNVTALAFLLDLLPAQLVQARRFVTVDAARVGHLPALWALINAGWPLASPHAAASEAARGGHLHVVVWLVEWQGAAGVRFEDKNLFAAAAESGSVELLAWLRGRGCPWDYRAFTEAAKAGSADALEWLAEQGCPMPGDGRPYDAACRNGDLATLRCLQRLGLPWGRAGAVITAAVSSSKRPPAILRWLLQAGCPVDFAAARAAVERWRGLDPRAAEALLAVLQEHEQ